jgi:8-hydroxy-5-deazaflavin:NADPH oxidoreductase
MNIAVVGSGHIGGLVGKLLAQAGHNVRFSSRHPETLAALVAESGPNASRGGIADAIAFGAVAVLALPYGSLPAFGREYGAQLAGKVVIETGNPYPERDGDSAAQVIQSKLGTGIWTARWLAQSRVVRGFSTVASGELQSGAHRVPPRLGVPLAADDSDAMAIAAGLVRDAGFDPVLVGPLARAREFDVGTAVYGQAVSGSELRKAFGLSL